jgi:rare lipoprotein A
MRNVVAILLIASVLSGCGHKRRGRLNRPPGPPPPLSAAKPGVTETGIACWYGHAYHGRIAADGDIYDLEKLTAAHRTLPFNTWVRVYDLDNTKTVDVRIIDRGPFVDGRIIDLSHAAARDIEMIGPGVARVRIEVIRAPEAVPPGRFAVQVGAFRDRGNAERLRSRMEARYGAARLIQRPGASEFWRVLVGGDTSEEDAKELAGRIQRESGENIVSFVVRIDAF